MTSSVVYENDQFTSPLTQATALQRLEAWAAAKLGRTFHLDKSGGYYLSMAIHDGPKKFIFRGVAETMRGSLPGTVYIVGADGQMPTLEHFVGAAVGIVERLEAGAKVG